MEGSGWLFRGSWGLLLFGSLLGLAGNCSLALTQPPELIASTVWSIVSSHGQGKGIWESLREYRKASRQKKKGIYLLISHWTKQVTWPYPASGGRRSIILSHAWIEVNQSLGGCPCRLPQGYWCFCDAHPAWSWWCPTYMRKYWGKWTYLKKDCFHGL